MLMDKQMSLSALSDELAQVRTKKKEFLAQIDRIVPWGEWIALIPQLQSIQSTDQAQRAREIFYPSQS